MTSSLLSLIAATGHQVPAAHVVVMVVLIVGVVVAIATARRRHSVTGDLRDRPPADGTERDRSEP